MTSKKKVEPMNKNGLNTEQEHNVFTRTMCRAQHTRAFHCGYPHSFGSTTLHYLVLLCNTGEMFCGPSVSSFFSHLWNQPQHPLQSHFSLQVFKTDVHHHLRSSSIQIPVYLLQAQYLSLLVRSRLSFCHSSQPKL